MGCRRQSATGWGMRTYICPKTKWLHAVSLLEHDEVCDGLPQPEQQSLQVAVFREAGKCWMVQAGAEARDKLTCPARPQ